MTSKEKFYLLKVLVITESKQYKHSCELHNLEKHEHISIQDCVSDIEKDLDRLEKYDKAKKIIKKKYVDVVEIVYISKAYVKELWVDVYNQNKQCPNVLTQEEFDFILKMFK